MKKNLCKNYKITTKTKTLVQVICILALQGCYSIKQGWRQVDLLLERERIKDVLATGNETPERLKKIKLVPEILKFAQHSLALTPGNSYQHYVRLKNAYLSYIVQAAPIRKLELKTWWFPVIGNQPYLGFFNKEEAKSFKLSLENEGFDTSLGTVQAFSLLGYFPDPIYSSMLDNTSIPEFIETLIHEIVHRTFYLPDFSSFNENLADFIGKQGAIVFFKAHPEIQVNIEDYRNNYLKKINAQKKFKNFLVQIKKELNSFYEASQKDPKFENDIDFLRERSRIFTILSQRYADHMQGTEKGTGYEHAFSLNHLNNAVIMGYSLYEANQTPFEGALARAQGNIATLVQSLQPCLKHSFKNESELWQEVTSCPINLLNPL